VVLSTVVNILLTMEIVDYQRLYILNEQIVGLYKQTMNRGFLNDWWKKVTESGKEWIFAVEFYNFTIGK